MIDTIRLEIPYKKDLVKAIYKAGANVNVSFDSGSRTVNYRYIRGNKALGSYDRNVNLFIYEDIEKIFIEFSVPKYIFGHNVFMVYPDELDYVFDSFLNDLNRVYKVEFPHYNEWIIKRLDVCYNWRFDSQKTAENVFFHLSNFSFPRKKRQVYDTGVFYKAGNYHSIKLYLKQPEFYVHDYKALKKNPDTIDLAYDFHTWSAGVLRFEISIKNAYLKKIKKSFSIKDLSYIFVLGELNKFLKQYLKTDFKEFEKLGDVIKKLENRFSKKKALRLGRFWYITNTIDSDVVSLLYQYDRTTIWRNKRDLASCNVGLLDNGTMNDLVLSIPSDICTNNNLLSGEPPEGGAGITDVL